MTFPAIVPSTRTFTPGDLPQSGQATLSGLRTGFRRGNRRNNQTLSLSFTNLTEAQLNEIKAHYIDRRGTFDIFYLPPEAWNGYSSPPVGLLSDFAWRYAGPPTISDGIVGRWAVDVELRTYAIDISDLIFDAEQAAATPARTYILDAGGASVSPARDYVTGGFGAQ
jgi:hypothetical protein